MNFEKFNQYFENSIIEGEKIIINSNIHEVLQFITTEFHFDILKEIIASDKGNNEIELLYRLYSTKNQENLVISKIIQNEVESVSDIFKSAIADEREIYDLFGVNFINHEGLKRLYMPEDWEGSPLRKDYIESDERLAWNDNNNV